MVRKGKIVNKYETIVTKTTSMNGFQVLRCHFIEDRVVLFDSIIYFKFYF